MLIAPTERPPISTLGTATSLPEQWGCDILIHANSRWAGIQRKAVPDLLSSLADGRLSKELMQMDACNRLDCRVLIIEGSASFTNEGVLMGHGYGQPFTLAQFRGLLWSVRARGVWVDRTESPHDTAVWLKMFEAWWGKEKHTSLVNRPGARGVWGKPDQREFGIHFLMGIPGVGSELAGNIYDYFGGIPARWTVNEKELMEVKGVGKGKAKQIFGTLNGSTEKSPD